MALDEGCRPSSLGLGSAGILVDPQAGFPFGSGFLHFCAGIPVCVAVLSSLQMPTPSTKNQKADPTLERVAGMVLPLCESRGLLLVGVSWAADRSGRILRVTIEPKSALESSAMSGPDVSVSLEECAWLSRSLSELLDSSEDFLPEAYHLEVGSPGVERELCTEADFRRFCGRVAKVKLSRPVADGQRVLRGTIVSVEPGESIIMLVDGKEQRFDLAAVNLANLVYELPKAALSADEPVKKAPKQSAAKGGKRNGSPSKASGVSPRGEPARSTSTMSPSEKNQS